MLDQKHKKVNTSTKEGDIISNFCCCTKFVSGIFNESDKGFLRFFTFLSFLVNFRLNSIY